MTALDSASLKFWESVGECGTVLVIVGVTGEALEIVLKWIEHKAKSHCFNKWCEEQKFLLDVFLPGVFWILVVGGLILEFRGSHKAQLIVQQENNRITQELDNSKKSIEALVKENTQVRGELSKVDSMAKRRIMTAGQEQAFMREVSKFAGAQYRITSENDNEVDDLVKQLTEALNGAGWREVSPPQHFSRPSAIYVGWWYPLDLIIRNGVTVEAVPTFTPVLNPMHTTNTTSGLAGHALVDALIRVDISTRWVNDWQLARPPNAALDPNIVYIRVGFRPYTGWDGSP